MTDKLREALSHGVIAVLFALGLTLPMLGALSVLQYAWMAVIIAVGLTLVLAVSSLNRWTKLGVAAVMVLGCAAWLLTMGGMNTLVEIVRAMVLHLSGQTAALPLYAREAAMLLAMVITLIAWVITLRGVGFYPAMAVLLLVVLVLWLSDQAALIVYALPAVAGAVCLLVLCNHEEMSLVRILPLSAVAVVVSFLLVPAGGVVSPTLKQSADDLRQRIFDYIFFTETRDVFSLSAEGYYPQGQTQLGGKAEPTDHPVMMVVTPRRVYLRGSVMNEYTGRVWRNTTGGRRYLWISPRWTEIRSDLFSMALPSGRLGESNGIMAEQEVRVQILSSNASTLFVPQRVRAFSPGGDLVPYFNNASEIFATRNLEPGDTYTVTAPLMLAGDAGLGTLINACADVTDDAYADMVDTYTQLPDHLQEPVYNMARKAAEGATTPYEQAFAIQNYLSRNFRYTLDVAEQPENIDFVTNFLINTKEGYCTYFASAMTVMCRMIGLPARYVEGYLATPDENGQAYVTGLQAHAWTEVYFSGFGWLTFDATPAQNNSVTPPETGDDPDDSTSDDSATPTPPPPEDSEGEATQPPENEPSPTPSRQPEDAETPTPSPDNEAPNQMPPNEENSPNLAWLWLLLPLLLIALLVLRVLMMQPQRCAAREKDENGRFMAWNQAVFDALRMAKLPSGPAESPMAYMRRMDETKRFLEELFPLGESLALIFYSKVAPEPEETDMAREAYEHILAALTLLEKLKLNLYRAFIPLKHRDFTLKGSKPGKGKRK